MNKNTKNSRQSPDTSRAICNMTVGIIVGGSATVAASMTFPFVRDSYAAMMLAVAGVIIGGGLFFKGFFALPGFYDLAAAREIQKSRQS